MKITYVKPAHRPALAIPVWGSVPPGLVRVPDPPRELTTKERARVEKMAHQVVKRGYRRQAEDYPVPTWIARSARRKEYYLARLRFELALREGYKK